MHVDLETFNKTCRQLSQETVALASFVYCESESHTVKYL